MHFDSVVKGRHLCRTTCPARRITNKQYKCHREEIRDGHDHMFPIKIVNEDGERLGHVPRTIANVIHPYLIGEATMDWYLYFLLYKK